MNKIDKIYSPNIKEYSQEYFKYLSKVLSDISLNEIDIFVKTLIDARNLGATIYFIGNGGSAATSSHFANDIAIGTREYDKPFKVVSLCDNSAAFT